MDTTILAAIVTVLGTGLLAMIGAFAAGRFVPVARVERADREAEKWRLAYDEMRRAQEQQARLLDRLQLSAEITDNVMTALARRGQVTPAGDES